MNKIEELIDSLYEKFFQTNWTAVALVILSLGLLLIFKRRK